MFLKTGFAQIFSCCPKNLSCPQFGGAAAPLAPPARTPMILKSLSKRKLHTQPIFFTSGLHKPIFPRNIIKID